MTSQKKNLSICTWNLCLGLQYKLNYVKEILFKENIDILCLQETELEVGFDMNNLHINGYEIETDLANNTIRTVIYIKTTMSYEKLVNQHLNQNLIILRITQQNMPRLFISAIYRPWRNIDGLSQEDAFMGQVSEMERLIPRNSECLILGDLNIDYAKRNNRNVVNRSLTQVLKTMVENHSLEQVVSFNTWSRSVNGHFRSSILDHVYTNDADKIKSVTSISIPISDHTPVKVEYEFQSKSIRKTMTVRNWKNYSKEKWLAQLKTVDWEIT
jgi:endonuclease/exonuclease/phosphatase family metal-dependent hydrolase